MEDSTSCRAPQSSQAFSPKCKSANMAILKEGFPLNPTPVVFSCCSLSAPLCLLSSTVTSFANAMSLVISSNQRIVALVMIWTITIFFISEARRNQKLHKIWGLNWMRSCERIKKQNQWRTLGTVIYILRGCNSLVFYSIDRKKYIDQYWSQLIEKCNQSYARQSTTAKRVEIVCLLQKNPQTNFKTNKVDSSSLRSIICSWSAGTEIVDIKANSCVRIPRVGPNLRTTPVANYGSLIQWAGCKMEVEWWLMIAQVAYQSD